MKANLFILLIALSCASCVGIKPVAFKSVDNIELPGVGMSPKITSDLTIHNPNSYGACLSNIELELFSGETSLGTLGVIDKVKIKRKSDVILPVAFTASLFDLAFVLPGKIKELQSPQGMEVRIKGDVQIQKFIFKKNFEVALTERVKL